MQLLQLALLQPFDVIAVSPECYTYQWSVLSPLVQVAELLPVSKGRRSSCCWLHITDQPLPAGDLVMLEHRADLPVGVVVAVGAQS